MNFLKRVLDWDKYIARMVPLPMRGQARFTDLLKWFYNHFKTKNQDLIDFRKQTIKDYTGSAQLLVLEKLLRDKWDPGQPNGQRIWVINNEVDKPVLDIYKTVETEGNAINYAYTQAELADIGLSIVPSYIYTTAEMNDDSLPDFKIRLLFSIWCFGNEYGLAGAELVNAIKQVVNRFKIYASTYVVTITDGIGHGYDDVVG
jgi:hypothetical protein